MLILRKNRKMFMGVTATGDTPVYTRLEGFSSLSESKNAQEYSRKYVDMSMETTDVTGYSSSYGFTFDLSMPNPVLTDIADIIDNEKIGSDAEREFISVDFHKPIDGGYEAVKRTFSIIGDAVGDGTDALTYSGTLKVKSEIVKGTAVITDGDNEENVKTISFTPDAVEE